MYISKNAYIGKVFPNRILAYILILANILLNTNSISFAFHVMNQKIPTTTMQNVLVNS